MNYLEEKLEYTDDGRLLDSQGRAVMMEWEREIMKQSAKVVCANRGRILNVGFGLGIVDSYIQSYDIDSHWIIEAHKDVYRKMDEDGWLDRDNVTVVYKRWQDAIELLPKFDGIYFDTWNDSGFKELFIPKLPELLKLGGVFSYWGHHPNLQKEKKMFERFGMEVSAKEIVLTDIPSLKEQGDLYWSPKFKTYNVLIIRKVREVTFEKGLI